MLWPLQHELPAKMRDADDVHSSLRGPVSNFRAGYTRRCEAREFECFTLAELQLLEIPDAPPFTAAGQDLLITKADGRRIRHAPETTGRRQPDTLVPLRAANLLVGTKERELFTAA